MPTINVSPAASGDDGHDWNDSGFSAIATSLSLGDSGGVGYQGFVRFPNVTVPQGATITTAKIQFTALFADSGTNVNVDIAFMDHDNAPAPTDSAELNTAWSGPGSTVAITWSNIPAWSGDQQDADTLTPELSSTLQPVFNRAGWASGNAVVALFDGTFSTADTDRRPKTFDWGDDPPVLSITYEEASGTPFFTRLGAQRV